MRISDWSSYVCSSDLDVRIRAWIAPLDEFSFPSGHTLNAVAFSLVAVAHYPALAWLVLPFAASVAASRVVLGLPYPSDVLADTAIGSALAALSMRLVAGMSTVRAKKDILRGDPATYKYSQQQDG